MPCMRDANFCRGSKKDEYIEGIQCHFCVNQFSDEDRKRFEERQKQINKSKKKKQIIYKN